MRTATASDIPAIRTTLARAYASDPLIQWIFPDEAHRPDATAAWLGLFLDLYVPAGGVRVIEDSDVAAAAVWRTPGDSPPSAGTLPTFGGLLAALVGSERAAAVGNALHAISSVTPTDAFTYLQILAVHPAHQRRGLGGRLMDAGIERSEALGLGVHLETTNPQNLPFYEAHGFSVTSSLRLSAGGPELWAMYRAPEAAGSPT